MDHYQSALVHLSDIECGDQNRAERPTIIDSYKKCADRLIQDITTELVAKRGFATEQIGLMITGDIASKGKAAEYDKAAHVIEHIRASVGIVREHIAIVPGNHDVNWDECRRTFLEELPDFSEGNPDHRERARGLPAKFAAFREFLRGICGCEFERPETVLVFEGLKQLGVALVGFDSTYPCTFSEEDNYGLLRDAPILEVGAGKLGELLEENKRLIPMAILHHCPNPLRDDNPDDSSYLRNAKEAVGWLARAGFSIVLCGHEHQSRATLRLRRQLQVFTTGSYGLSAGRLLRRYHGTDRVESNKYEIFLIRPEGTSEVLFRKLAEPGSNDAEWIEDADEGPARMCVRFHRPQLVQADHDALQRQMNLLVSRPFPLPGGRRWVISMSLNGPPEVFSTVRSVTYRVGGSSVEMQNRAAGFLADAEIGQIQGQRVEAAILTEDGELDPISVEDLARALGGLRSPCTSTLAVFERGFQ